MSGWTKRNAWQSYCAVEPQDKVRRWSKSESICVNRPHIVKEYNTFIGGIDLLDACVARYKYHMRSRRWYRYLFWQTIMLGLVNTWLIYCCDCKLLGVHKPLKLVSFSCIHKGVAHHSMPHLHHHLPREFVLEFQMMFVWTRLQTGL